MSYPLAQNATQTYSNAGFGAYLQITPNSKLAFAGGFQEATNVTADTIEANLGTGKYAYFLSGQWTPGFLSGGNYSFLFYHQPFVPQQPSSSYGYSLSAVQNINSDWGLFMRINNASGDPSAILTSLAGGVTVNNPFGRNELDRLGFGVAEDWTNKNVTGGPARKTEALLESYYNFTVSKPLQLTPDVQVYFNPALAQTTDIAAVFTLRVTLNL
jgi:carbohydrate-selective porin OprB